MTLTFSLAALVGAGAVEASNSAGTLSLACCFSGAKLQYMANIGDRIAT